MAQLNLDREIATQASEHYLIRNYSPTYTLGGGRILEINAGRHRRFDKAVTDRLETVATGNVGLIIRQLLDQSGAHGIGLDELAIDLGLDRAEIEQVLSEIDAVSVTGNRWVSRSAYEAVLRDVLATVQSFHDRAPLKSGIDLGSLNHELTARADPAVVKYAVTRLIDDAKLQNVNEILSLAGYDPFAAMGDGDRRLTAVIEQAFLKSGIEWLSPQAVVGSDSAKRAAFDLLLGAGRLVRLKTSDRHAEMFVHARGLATAKQAIESAFPLPGSFALKDVRDLLGSTRKHIVPLMEHLDATGFTVRHGDTRRLRETGAND